MHLTKHCKEVPLYPHLYPNQHIAEEEEWDPDFEEFDTPSSAGKKGAKKAADDDEFKVDDEFKDLFDDKDDFDDDDDDSSDDY